MLDDLSRSTTDITRQKFRRRKFSELFENQNEGFAWEKGVHLYSELRPAVGLQVAETDTTAQRYLSIIEEYAHAGVHAARIFGFELLELQGTVLHFKKEGEFSELLAFEALQFSYIFTKVLYQVLAQDLGEDWNGFALCMDHGEAVIIRHGKLANGSCVSLGPVANNPAKRLLHGKTAAGFAEIPGVWVQPLFGRRCTDPWYAINLRDRQKLPELSAFENVGLERELREVLLAYRARRSFERRPNFKLTEASELITSGSFSTKNPLRMRAYCLRADFDGFCKVINAAFQRGEEAVEIVAKSFVKLLEFGDFFERKHYGTVRMPWAGDCVSFLIPASGEICQFRGYEWIRFVEEWQSFSQNSEEGRVHQWYKLFQGVTWAVGMSYASDGLCLVAPVQANSREFLIAAGAPVAVAHTAQNLGKGDETLIHNSDYEAAFPVVRKQFSRVTFTEFWSTKKLTTKKIHDAAVNEGTSEKASTIEVVTKGGNIVIPKPRPYCA